MPARFLIGSLALALALGLSLGLGGCVSASPSPTRSLSDHAEHDAAAERLMDALADAFGMSFEPAGPHHELGTAPDGVQLDLVGVPVEELVLSLPTDDRSAAVAAGLAYLPHLRDLLHGPDPVWGWVADALACRIDADAMCNVSTSQGNLTARFTDGGQGFLVLVITRA